MGSLAEALQAISYEAAAVVHGESVVLVDADGNQTTVSDCIVDIETAAGLTPDAGRAEFTGSVRLPELSLAAARTAQQVIAQGQTLSVIACGNPFAGRVRIEISSFEDDHTNIFDINDNEAVWGS